VSAPARGMRAALVSPAARSMRRVPVAAWICAALAIANAVTFSLIVPAFQVPDEPEHYAYTEFLVQSGRPPYAPPPATEFSPQEQAALEGLYFPTILGGTGFGRPPWTQTEAAHVRQLLSASPSLRSQGGVTGESGNPPAYYALEAIPYEIASGSSFFDRLEAMRMLSALLFGLTVMFVFGFVRESLREPRWAASAAALAVAFQPQAAFIAGGVNNDNLMFTAAAALFWLLARAHRRGMNARRGAAIGLALAIGLLTKLTFIGLLPGVLVALALIALRQRGRNAVSASDVQTQDRGETDGIERQQSAAARSPLRALSQSVTRMAPATRGLLASAVVTAIPVAAYVILNTTVWHRSLFQGALGTGPVTGTPASGTASGNFRELLSYIWQFYLPRLPGMRAQFSFYPLWHIWFKGFVGDFGLLDYGFANWVYYLAGAIFLMLAALALRALVSERRSLRSRWPEIVSYGAITIGLLLAIARAGFPYHLQTHFVFEQARYLFPLLALYGLFLAVALRGAGRRWSPALAGVLVVVMIAHDLFAQLLTLQRYWT